MLVKDFYNNFIRKITDYWCVSAFEKRGNIYYNCDFYAWSMNQLMEIWNRKILDFKIFVDYDDHEICIELKLKGIDYGQS